MSMLAGPRRKQKVINLRAKNNEWSNDKNKFGQRMLEKMGWSEGKGLGANENGIVQHVIARYKNDEKGLGYVDRNDQWTKHEDDFNALLANLSSSSDQKLSPEVLHSGKSLETKSKKSKARIHYHKFTRGKDLARYSEKDLANIFGKKTLKENENDEPPKEDDRMEKVFTEKGSMYDYFRNKMANVKNVSGKLSEPQKDNGDEDLLDYSFQGFNNSNLSPQDSEIEEPKSSNKNAVLSFYPQMPEKLSIKENGDTPNVDIEESQTRKKKKKSKQKDVSEAASNLLQENNNTTQKKKKSKKRNREESEEEQVVKKKKKKEKISIEHTDESAEVVHKKRKK